MNPSMTPIVRKFSLQLGKRGGNDDLSHALSTVAMVEQAEISRRENEIQVWRTWLRDGPNLPPDSATEAKRLHAKTQEIIQTWKEFKDAFPEDAEQSDQMLGLSVPTIGKLRAAVTQAAAERRVKNEKSFGRVKKHFFGFLDTMNNYSDIFKVIPDSSEYTSLIIGVVSSITKATVNHSNIEEMIPLSLNQISVYMGQVRREHDVLDQSLSTNLLLELYAAIFEYLCHVMSWYKSRRRRILVAFKKNFCQELFQKVETIKTIVGRFFHETERVARDLARETHGQVSKIMERLEDVGQESRYDLIPDIQRKVDVLYELFVGGQAGQYLNAVAQQHSHDRITNATRLLIQDREVVDAGEDSLDGSGSESSFQLESGRAEMLHLMPFIEPYIEDGRDALEATTETRPFIPHEVLAEVQKWVKAEGSRRLWVEGIAAPRCSLSLLSMQVYSASMKAGIACISYFAKTQYNFSGAEDIPRTEAATISLIYLFLAQVLHLLPDKFERPDNLEEGVFDRLDGTLNSCAVALDLIEALLPYTPPSLFVVIDGMVLAEASETTPYLRDLLSILYDRKEVQLLKLLFITDGNSQVLANCLDVTERVSASRMAQARGRRHMPGGARLDELGPM